MQFHRLGKQNASKKAGGGGVARRVFAGVKLQGTGLKNAESQQKQKEKVCEKQRETSH